MTAYSCQLCQRTVYDMPLCNDCATKTGERYCFECHTVSEDKRCKCNKQHKGDLW